MPTHKYQVIIALTGLILSGCAEGVNDEEIVAYDQGVSSNDTFTNVINFEGNEVFVSYLDSLSSCIEEGKVPSYFYDTLFDTKNPLVINGVSYSLKGQLIKNISSFQYLDQIVREDLDSTLWIKVNNNAVIDVIRERENQLKNMW